LATLAGQGSISRVAVADPEIHQDSDAAQALIALKLRGIKIESAVETFARAKRKIWIEGLSAERLIFAGGFSASGPYLSLKRVLDIILSVGLLVVTAPLLVLIAVAIKLDTPGRAIFSQERVGFMGRRFMVHKFRSM